MSEQEDKSRFLSQKEMAMAFKKSCLEVMKGNDAHKRDGQLEILDWMLEQTMTGMTLPMLRVQIHNKRVEISGEGERA